MRTLLTMKITILCAVLLLSSLTSGQIWTNAPNGLTVKTVYVPMQKGSASIPIPDFSQIRPLATLNIPNFAVNGDLQLASTLNQQFRPKLNAYEPNVRIQDVRAKPNQQQIKTVLQGQIPNFQILYHNPNLPQQQQNNPQNQQLRNHPVVQQQSQLYQPEQILNFLNIHPQNIVTGQQKNNSGIQYQNNDHKNGNMATQDGYMNVGNVKILHPQHGANYIHQIHTPDNIVNPKNVVSNFAYTQYHNIQNPVQNFKPQSNVNQQSTPSHNTIINNAGESTRYFQQMLSNKPTNQQSYISPPSESSSHATNQQINYGNPNVLSIQHTDSSNRNVNPFQGFQNQDNSQILEHSNNQQQLPVNTYAIVHQRVPTNHFAIQNNQQAASQQQQHGNASPSSQSSEPSSPPSQGYYVNNESPNYIQTTQNQEQSSYQGAPQNQMNVENQQNSPGNTQYQEQQTVPGSMSMSNQQYSGHPGTAHTQLIMSQFHRSQQESSEAKYIKHQQSSNAPQAQNQEVKSNQQQNSEFYPDPSSETYYPDNKQLITIAPPPDYYPQNQQQQPTREQEYVRYSSPSDSSVLNGQISVSSQNGQVALPNRNYGYNQDPVYNNNYGQSVQ